MKAARLHNYNEYLQIDVVDEPQATGPLDVSVRLGAARLCRTDIYIKDGRWKEGREDGGLELHDTLGQENDGWVKHVGSEVT